MLFNSEDKKMDKDVNFVRKTKHYISIHNTIMKILVLRFRPLCSLKNGKRPLVR